MKITIAFLSALVVVAACRSTTAPYADVSVAVDSAVYHLQGAGGHYRVTLTATITNGSNRDIYLRRGCPERSLQRPEGHNSRLLFGQIECALPGSFSPLSALTLPPGAVHAESFTLMGSEQPQARPQITMDELTGPAVFGFLVSRDLRIFEPVMSPAFVLKPPG